MNERRGKLDHPERISDVSMNTSVNDYIINMNEANHIVYCRFGEKFISDLQKRKHSNICASN
jgi:hypothetical protein